MSPYQPLPRIAPRAQDEPLLLYAARVLRFITDTRVTATLSDIDLELADHVYPLAVSNPDMTDATRQRLTACRHDIISAIARRRRMAQDADATPAPAAPAPTPTNGHAVKLIPVLPTRPPAGALADF